MYKEQLLRLRACPWKKCMRYVDARILTRARNHGCSSARNVVFIFLFVFLNKHSVWTVESCKIYHMVAFEGRYLEITYLSVGSCGFWRCLGAFIRSLQQCTALMPWRAHECSLQPGPPNMPAELCWTASNACSLAIAGLKETSGLSFWVAAGASVQNCMLLQRLFCALDEWV